MFDTIKCLIAGFTQELEEKPKAEKLVWILLIAFVAGWFVTLFAAWVSLPAYAAMNEALPYSTQVALFFTISIAVFLYFTLSYLSGFAVEIWVGVNKSDRDYTKVGARIFLACTLIFLTADLYMSWKGREYRADENAGTEQVFAYTTSIQDLESIQTDKDKLSDLLRGKFGGYGWKEKGVYYLNQSGKKYQRSLSENIRRVQQADSTNRALYISDMERKNSKIDQTRERLSATLGNAVKGVYAFMLMLCIAQAFCVETIQREAPEVFAKSGVKSSASLPINPRHVKSKTPVMNSAISNPSKSAKSTRQLSQSKAQNFSATNQPPLPRGIDKRKYNKLVKYYGKIPLKKDGQPNKLALSTKTGISRSTIAKYIDIAIKRNDIKEGGTIT